MSFLQIAGYASLFGIKDLAGDIVERGAFAKSLKQLPAPSVRMLYQHNGNKPIGEWTKLFEDEAGLWAEGLIYDVSDDASLAQSMIKSGQMDGLSIGFRTLDFTPINGGRILKEIDLREISLVAFPMLTKARLKLINQSIAA
jgi:HK97 family phage prohead protease